MDELKTLETLGFTPPSPAYIAAAIVFGIIGFAAYRYGKKTARAKVKWIGVALMFYPYVISGPWLLYVVGAGLCIGLYFVRD
jgi:hypothetical protein